jgi:hypothetical protein
MADNEQERAAHRPDGGAERGPELACQGSRSLRRIR